MVLFVGLVPLGHRQRESFQEFDIRGWFGTTAKRVLVLDQPGRAGEIVAEAFFAARSGRPGPVVVGLPEDVHRGSRSTAPPVDPLPVADGAVSPAELHELGQLLGRRRAAAGDDRRQRVEPGRCGRAHRMAGAGRHPGASPSGVPPVSCPATRRCSPAPSATAATPAAAAAARRGRPAAGRGHGARRGRHRRLRAAPATGRADRDRLYRPGAHRTRRPGRPGSMLARPDVFAAALADPRPRRPGPEWSAWRQRLRAAAGALRRRRPTTGRSSPRRRPSMTAVMRELLPAAAPGRDAHLRRRQPLRLGAALPPDAGLPGAAVHPQRLHGLQHPVRGRGRTALPAAAGRQRRRRRRVRA